MQSLMQSPMRPPIRLLRPATAGFILFCFALPFFTLSCPGGSYPMSGIRLATGTTIEGTRVPPDLVALASLAISVVLLAMSFGTTRSACAATAITAPAQAVLLLILRFRAQMSLAQEGRGMFQLQTDLGFWLAIVGCLALFAVSLQALEDFRAARTPNLEAAGIDPTSLDPHPSVPSTTSRL